MAAWRRSAYYLAVLLPAAAGVVGYGSGTYTLSAVGRLPSTW
jgi:hypothetical protein